MRSVLRQYRPLASGADRQSVGHPRPHGSGRPYACTVPPPGRRPLGPPSFFATAGPLGPWAGGSRGPERFVRPVGPRLRLVACVSSPPALRPLGPLRLPVPRRGSALWSVARARGFGLQRGRGCAPLWRSAPSLGFRSLRLLPPAPCRRCAAAAIFSYRGDVAFSASPGSWARPGRDGAVPLKHPVPCPSSFAAENPGLTNSCLCCTIIHG